MKRTPIVLVSNNASGTTGASVAAVVVVAEGTKALNSILLGTLSPDPEIDLAALVCLERAKAALVNAGFPATAERGHGDMPGVIYLRPGADVQVAATRVVASLELLVGAGVVTVDRTWHNNGDEYTRAELHYFKKLLQDSPAEVASEQFRFVQLPAGNAHEFAALNSEMSRRGVRAQFSDLKGGGRLYRVPVEDLKLLPSDEKGPYFGDDHSGHGISTLDASVFENDRSKYGATPWAPVAATASDQKARRNRP